MTSIVRPASPHSSHVIPPNKKFRTVLGFGPLFKDTDPRPTFTRNSADTARSYSYHKKPRPSIASSTFFRPQQGNIQSQNTPAVDPAPSENMTVESAVHSHPARRPPMRMDTQDGPWSVSVAETPHDARSYSLYIKTPTHNLTLTRTAMEIVELDHKLRDAHPTTSIPALPIDALTLPAPPPKRKSTFLNTLSRLASPTAKSGRSAARRATNSSISISTNATPLTSPSGELGDPFTSFATNAEGEEAPAPSKNSTGVAAYLTTVSNTAALRQARVWKRFVRVRTDDLESVRVERAIKRVRSDIAAHVGLDKEKEKEPPAVESTDPSATPSETASVANEQVVSNGSAHATAVDLTGDAPETHSIPEADVEFIAKALDQAEAEEEADKEERKEEENITAKETITTKAKISDVRPHPPRSSLRHQRPRSSPRGCSARSPRTQTNPRASRVPLPHESSVSTTSARKKTKRTRARSSDGAPKEARRSQRKVVIDDFEMMRVLGKGCAGKVLLVKHKSTADLYALKAITKRASHTLTEQAVLKRMAAESKDPFVVKLWWSFHDKENLFLVMLARWGRLGRDRARFYAAEIVEGVEGLHAAGVIYRDLKPENILIGADGHIPRGAGVPAAPPWMRAEKGGEVASGWPGQPVGQSDATSTFCGTAEYLAPEVIQGLPYSYEVDWWSFGTMLYEMLTGITPFWANNHSDMYVRLLQRNPGLRMCEPRIKRHPYFSMIDWSHVYYKRYIRDPIHPPIDPSNASDTQNFDDTFLDMEP
ncbi:kinase-like domain-containing protein, partial [Infundibulicybe gibba]